MNFVDLLENYLILKERDKDLYYDVKDNIDKYKSFIYDNLAYDIIIKDDFIKLEKIPGIPEEWMGINEFTEIKEYIFFILLITFLEDKNKEEQFILSSITEYIEHNYPDEKIEWTIFKNRKSLIKVMKFAIDIGIIKKNDGSEEEFSKSETGDVLYESTGLSRYIVRRFSKNIEDSESYEDLLGDEFSGISKDLGTVRKNRVFRRLLLSPVVYNDENDNGDYDYIKSKRSFIRNTFEENLGWDIHIHKNGALAALENSNEVKDIFPNKKGESAAVLFINKEVRRNINSGNLKKEDNDTVVMRNSEFDEFIIEVRRTHGHGFTKTLRDVSEQVFINIIRNFMKDFSMIREEKDFTILMPIIGKVLGEYPEDYKGEAKDE
ncbi:TIGR02678 family protein [uncultured Clostridium sp.]|uniref:TIGR02678 family protein n=1 Tax=uncultured Clostridium sp. TaxID=59620 RepID=UPI002670F353|nr:TIGR02678 family protein [uncultured Clostridium sp.]